MGQAVKTTRFYFQPDYGDRGDCFVVLAGARWTSFLVRRAGIQVEPFFQRDSLAHEPDTFKNGHPYAWLYRSADDLLRDERRWMAADELAALAAAVDRVQTRLLQASPTPTPPRGMPEVLAPALAAHFATSSCA